MRKFLTLLLLLTSQALCYGQDMSVESFTMDASDLDAKTYEIEYDANGRKAAIIKIQTTEKGFQFDTGGFGVVKTYQDKGGEVWVYVPAGVMRLSISQQQLGRIQYEFPIPIKSATVYRMKLTSNKVETIVHQNAGGHYLQITSTPAEVELIVDGGAPIAITGGVGSSFQSYGEHTYTVQAKHYKPSSGVVNIGNERKDLTINLEPNFGYIEVNSTPSGANVELNGMVVGQTPYNSPRLDLGEYQIRVTTANYETFSQTINLTEGEKSESINAALKANFGYLAINSTPSGATVEINDMAVGTTPYKSGILPLGEHRVKVSSPNYGIFNQTINLIEGAKSEVINAILSANFGYIMIESTPSGATVEINDMVVGKTPYKSAMLPLGEHQVRVSSTNFTPFSQTVNLTEGAKSEVVDAILLANFGYIQVGSTPSGATVEINDMVVGKTPYKSAMLPLGEHQVRVSSTNFTPFSQTVNLTEGAATVTVNPTLVTNLSGVTISCAMSDAKIIINDTERGTGNWSGELLPGTYELKAEKSGHRAAIQQLVVVRNSPQSISLNAPTPMYGTLNISAAQSGVTASIDGKELGSLPNIFNNILVGKHILTLSKADFVSATAIIEINEGTVTAHNQPALTSLADSEEYQKKVTFNKAVKPELDEAAKSKLIDLFNAAYDGDAESQYKLGAHYHKGDGVTINISEAANWYGKAVKQGYTGTILDVKTCQDFARRYEYGTSTMRKNLTEAFKWYSIAAEMGDEKCQYKIGEHYQRGYGVEKDQAEAVKWYRKAAEQGNQYAQYNLGECYQKGNGVEQSQKEANIWYEKAAAKGFTPAKLALTTNNNQTKGKKKSKK